MGMNSNIFADFAKLQKMEKEKEISGVAALAGERNLMKNAHLANENVNTRTDVMDESGKVAGYDTADTPGDDGKPQKRSSAMQSLMTYHDTQLGKGASFGAKVVGYGLPGAATVGLGMASNHESQRGDGFGAAVLGSGAAVMGSALALAGLGRVGEANINKFAKSITGGAERMKGFAKTVGEAASDGVFVPT